jgi:integrase
MTELEGIPVVTAPSEAYLNRRQKQNYQEHRQRFLEWLAVLGKDPQKAQGYSNAVVKNTAYRTDQFYRWVWENKDGYTVNISHTEANEYNRHLAGEEHSNGHKAKCVKSLKRLFKWKHHEQGGDLWEPDITYTDSGSTKAQDYLTKEERQAIREAALEYGSIPAYNTVSPRERSRWKAYLAQRFGKPKSEVGLEDWERANGWKTPSMVWVSLDAGLRPIEVERAVVDWVDLENGVLRIPKEDSSKNQDNWIVALRDQTVKALNRWLDERRQYPKYDGTDNLWLTREGNPYQSHSLQYLLSKLAEIAGISIENRRFTWYAIRHSLGTYMSREDGLAATKDQLRHQSVKTTMRYDQTPVEDRKDALERMG